jgi:hypothetical protein
MDIYSMSHVGAADNLSRLPGKYLGLTEISNKKTSQTSDQKSDIDKVRLSDAGQELARSPASSEKNTHAHAEQRNTESFDSKDIKQLQELKLRDREVRTHEQAHLAIAGQYSRGGASYTYQKGPDGVSYAVGGEVGIDVGKERTPEATIAKMQTIKRAALAPASPSGADRSIAAHASTIEAQARQEILVQSQEELLQVEAVKNPAIGQEPADKRQTSLNIRSIPAQNTVRTMIAAYQRVAGS